MFVITNTCKDDTACNCLMPDIWMIKSKAVAGFYDASSKVLGQLCRTSDPKERKDSYKYNCREGTVKEYLK